jgi:hypothetical protein
MYPDPFAPRPNSELDEHPLSQSALARGGAIAAYGLPPVSSQAKLLPPQDASRSIRSQSSLDEKASGFSSVDVGRNNSLREIKAAAMGAVNKARSVGILHAGNQKAGGWNKGRLYVLATLVGILTLVGIGTGVGVSMAKKHAADNGNSAASLSGSGQGSGVQAGNPAPVAPPVSTNQTQNQGYQNLVVFGSGLNGTLELTQVQQIYALTI